jgi:DNA-nicking Smr family endonuclease
MRRNVPGLAGNWQVRAPGSARRALPIATTSPKELGDGSRCRVHNGKVKAKRPLVSVEDAALFMDAVKDARPLAARDRVVVPPKPASPVRALLRDELPPEIKLAVEGDGRRYAARAPGVSLAQVAELRTGKIHLEATLDLHGSTVDVALASLRQFLVESRRLGRRRVLVIHGKGLHSEHGAPLREAVVGELLGPASGLVHAFASAVPADGGEGATYVVLRSGR